MGADRDQFASPADVLVEFVLEVNERVIDRLGEESVPKDSSHHIRSQRGNAVLDMDGERGLVVHLYRQRLLLS